MLHNHALPQNDEVLSETESLELWWVTDAKAGIYTLTVNTGSKEFVVTVLTTTTSLKTGERLQFIAAVCLFVSYSISSFPEGWISNLVEGPRD